MLSQREIRQTFIQHGQSEFSQTSIFHSMDRFVRAVREMEDTVLIPSRLLDLTVGDSGDKLKLEGERGSIVKTTMANIDLYQLYNIISQMKVELLWSQDNINCLQELKGNVVPNRKYRRPSCFRGASLQNEQDIVTLSDSDSEVILQNGSGSDVEENANAAAKSFKKHLRELHRNIQKMTYAAEYLTQRYQTDVDRESNAY